MTNSYTREITAYFTKIFQRNRKNNERNNENDQNHYEHPPLFLMYECGKFELIIGIIGLTIIHLVVQYLYSISLLQFLRGFFWPEMLCIKYSDTLMLLGYLIWVFVSFFIFGLAILVKSFINNYLIKVFVTYTAIVLMLIMPVCTYMKWAAYYLNSIWLLRISFWGYMFLFVCYFLYRIFVDI